MKMVEDEIVSGTIFNSCSNVETVNKWFFANFKEKVIEIIDYWTSYKIRWI